MSQILQPPHWNAEPYGFTCGKCPQRGSRAIPGDFVGVSTPNTPTGRSTAVVGYPVRCKSCNAHYATYKRACEAIDRLYFCKPTQEDYRFLKFVTITREKIESKEAQPTAELIRDFKKWYVRGRDKIRDDLGLLGGTDVIECVTKKLDNGMYHHHLHIHGIWIMPKMKVKKWRRAFDKVGFGRDQIRAIEDEPYVDRFGNDRIMEARKCATKYLAKYLSKEKGSRRMMWGVVRRWKDFCESGTPEHIKTVHQYEKWLAAA